MKKIFICFTLLILLCGCTKEETFKCNIDLYNEIEEYTLTAEYKIYYEKTFVTKIEKKEEYKSDNKKTLEFYEEYKNLEHKNLNELYGNIEYLVERKKDKVLVSSTMNMELIDIKKMIRNKLIDRDYVISNKLTTGGIRKIYESKGAICEEG